MGTVLNNKKEQISFLFIECNNKTLYEWEGFFMNLNRQNNRCVTPPMPPFGNRPIGRPGQGGRGGAGMPNCNPCPENTNVCQEECKVCVPYEDNCNSCSDNNSSGGVISGCSNACNKESVLQGWALAMAYVPWQPYDNLNSLSQALRRGTIFRDLDFDFMGRRCN